jgi:hypothetical protein
MPSSLDGFMWLFCIWYELYGLWRRLFQGYDFYTWTEEAGVRPFLFFSFLFFFNFLFDGSTTSSMHIEIQILANIEKLACQFSKEKIDMPATRHGGPSGQVQPPIASF